jgi:hypothetical protein
LADTNTEDVLWADGEGARGACATGEGRASSIAREAIGGEGEEYDGMLLKLVEGRMKCDGITEEGDSRERNKFHFHRSDYAVKQEKRVLQPA